MKMKVIYDPAADAMRFDFDGHPLETYWQDMNAHMQEMERAMLIVAALRITAGLGVDGLTEAGDDLIGAIMADGPDSERVIRLAAQVVADAG